MKGRVSYAADVVHIITTALKSSTTTVIGRHNLSFLPDKLFRRLGKMARSLNTTL
jgi:hypothetical protein